MQHRAEVAHHSKGRMRLKVASAKGNPAALEEIRKSLLPVRGVIAVEVNDTTGSVTVFYDPRQHPDFQSHLAGSGAHRNVLDVPRTKAPKVNETLDLVEQEAEFLAAHSHTAKALFDVLTRIDDGVKRLTNNAIDLKVVTPLALAGFAFLELGITASTPMWVTLGLFSFNHFIELHSPAQPLTPETPQSRPVRRRRPVRFP
jgi:hypothetical protein